MKDKLTLNLYELENVLTELVIIALSLGGLTVAGWILFASSLNYTVIEFGNIIQPWVTMLALMIIGRELWMINRRFSYYLEMVDSEQGE